MKEQRQGELLYLVYCCAVVQYMTSPVSVPS